MRAHLLADLPEGTLRDLLSGLPDEHLVRIVSMSHSDDAVTILEHPARGQAGEDLLHDCLHN